MQIALDHDSTLAATATMAFELLGATGYSYEDIESWGWGLEEFGETAYLNALWHTWTIRPDDVPMMERHVEDPVYKLYNHDDVDALDIVTHHPPHTGISEGKQQWLGRYSIPYDEFVAIESSEKASMDYDVYIDDNPQLPVAVNELSPESTVYLRDQPYNRDADGEYTRIFSLSDVVDDLGLRS